MSSSQPVYSFGGLVGCDPEVFIFDKDGKIIPSFDFIPEKGIYTTYGKIARDGVQVELQPTAGTCRQEQAWGMSAIMNELHKRLPDGATVSFASNIVIPAEVFKNLDPEGRRLGCTPSQNVYGKSPIKVDPDKYRRRSAGGHLHFGCLFRTIDAIDHTTGERIPTKETVKSVKALDALLGNTSVLIDRDPAAAIRRRVYGRAGEYRLPAQDRLEYRTLSNFWLRSYYLQSMVYALGRQALGIVAAEMDAYQGGRCWDAFGELFSKLDEEKIRRAINKNDYDLAWENWLIVRTFLHDHASGKVGVTANNVDCFDRFLADVKARGLDKIFPQSDIHADWMYVNKHYSWAGSVRGFENWLANRYPEIRRDDVYTIDSGAGTVTIST